MNLTGQRRPALGVNVDHVATVRQARRIDRPDPVTAAALAELGGADGITVHLREDRRHIQDRDVRILRETAKVPLNLEMAATLEMISIAREVRPDQVTLVPERREELTTEGGLDAAGDRGPVRDAVQTLQAEGIPVYLFVDPDPGQADAGRDLGAHGLELHTGTYCDTAGAERARELRRVQAAATHAASLGLDVHAGHGLDYDSVGPVAAIEPLTELNIGHAIVARAVLVGMERAVAEMVARMLEARVGRPRP